MIQQGIGQQIVLKPADGYISSFIKDVNRGRINPCRTLITPGIGVEGPTVDTNLVIEEVARVLSAEGKDAVNVPNSRGKLWGNISMNDTIAAMVPPSAVDAM